MFDLDQKREGGKSQRGKPLSESAAGGGGRKTKVFCSKQQDKQIGRTALRLDGEGNKG